MTNTFKAEFDTYSISSGTKIGNTYQVVDELATRKSIRKTLEEHNVPKATTQWDDDGDYHFSITTLDGYRNSDRKKFRIYLDDDSYGSKSFIQSNDEGEIPLAKLIEKMTEHQQYFQNRTDRKRKENEASEKREKLAEQLSDKLSKYGIRVQNSYGRIVIKAEFYDNAEAEAFANELINKLN